MSLTNEQVALFRHNGFLRLPERLPQATVDSLKATIWRHIREEIAPIDRDREGRVVRISQIWDREPIFREAMTCAPVLDPLESLLGPNIELITNRHNHATLRLADEGAHYFHRDVLQWSRPIVTILFYLEDTTVENGCTWVIPGTQFLPGRRNNDVREDEELKHAGVFDQAVAVPMPEGGLLALDSLTIHTAGKNTTPGTRISMTVGYHSVDELSPIENPRRALVRGQRIYLGNDTDYVKPVNAASGN
jgi:ectoine hydroxylase-related dioxygenase (phytanoyl-CoA dioxygenase family)